MRALRRRLQGPELRSRGPGPEELSIHAVLWASPGTSTSSWTSVPAVGAGALFRAGERASRSSVGPSLSAMKLPNGIGAAPSSGMRIRLWKGCLTRPGPLLERHTTKEPPRPDLSVMIDLGVRIQHDPSNTTHPTPTLFSNASVQLHLVAWCDLLPRCDSKSMYRQTRPLTQQRGTLPIVCRHAAGRTLLLRQLCSRRWPGPCQTRADVWGSSLVCMQVLAEAPAPTGVPGTQRGPATSGPVETRTRPRFGC